MICFFPGLDAILDGVQKSGLVAEAGVESADGGAGAAHHFGSGESFVPLALDERFSGPQDALL